MRATCLLLFALAGCGGRALPGVGGDPELEGAGLLPAGARLSFVLHAPTAGSAFDVEVRGVEPGVLLSSERRYAGWCVDPLHTIGLETEYEATAFSSLGAEAAARQPADWHRINYLVNIRGSTYEPYVQRAIWHFIDGRAPDYQRELALTEEADAEGAGFVPGAGERLGVVLDAGPEVQLVLIEVELPGA